MAEVMAKYRRILVCAYYLSDGWIAKFTEDYLGQDQVFKSGDIVPEKFARLLFPTIHGRYIGHK